MANISGQIRGAVKGNMEHIIKILRSKRKQTWQSTTRIHKQQDRSITSALKQTRVKIANKILDFFFALHIFYASLQCHVPEQGNDECGSRMDPVLIFKNWIKAHILSTLNFIVLFSFTFYAYL